MKIKIIIPNKNDKYKILVDKSKYTRLNPVLAYTLVERKLCRLLASPLMDKINVIVNYDSLHSTKNNEWVNEGKYDTVNDALYVLACFMEDYLSKDLLMTKYKTYRK